MWELGKTKVEIEEFMAEVVRDNGPRYRDVTEWPHLWVDLWVSLFDMSYTLGHVVAILVPAALVGWALFS